MKYIVVENRVNASIQAMIDSCLAQGISLSVISNTNAGETFEEFSRSYVHLSTNTKSFELICFRRYFLIKNYIIENNIKEFFLLDSDVMVFDGILEVSKEISELNKKFVGSYVVGVSDEYKRISPHYSFWTKEALCDFVDYLIYSYKGGISKDVDLAHREFLSRGGYGGITDMTLLYFWARNNDCLFSSTNIFSGKIADHNITDASNYIRNHFKSFFGTKIIIPGDGGVFGIERNGSRRRFVLLHFQGKAKKMMVPLKNKKYITFVLFLFLFGFLKSIKRNIKF